MKKMNTYINQMLKNKNLLFKKNQKSVVNK